MVAAEMDYQSHWNKFAFPCLDTRMYFYVLMGWNILIPYTPRGIKIPDLVIMAAILHPHIISNNITKLNVIIV